MYNLGTGNGYSVLDMVKAFEKASGKKVIIINWFHYMIQNIINENVNGIRHVCEMYLSSMLHLP